MNLWQRVIKAIKTFYLAPLEIAFRQFRAGLIYFGVGFGTVLLANAHMEESLMQELVVLGGLLVGGLGFVLALIGQSRLLVGRLLHFWFKRD